MTAVTSAPDVSAEGSIRPDRGPGAHLFVWGVWAAMTLGALAFVARYGPSLPYFDDYVAVPYVTGEAPDTAAWLWAPHNEHRIPLPKLFLLGLLKLAHYDWRAGMYFNVLSMAVLALAMIRVAQHLRGWPSYFDALFPLLLLHLGHHENFLWSWQVGYTIPTLFVGILLMIIATRGAQLTPSVALLSGICLVLLPLCGANALALVPALALWFGYAGVSHLRSPQAGARGIGLILLTAVATALLLAGLYFLGLETHIGDGSMAGPRLIVTMASRFLTIGYGRAAVLFVELLAPGLVGLLLISTALLVGMWRKQPPERLRAIGLLLFMAAFVSLALGTGFKRPNLPSRYALLAAPIWCCVYFVWQIYGGPAVRYFVQTVLVFLTTCLVSLNTQQGLEFGNFRANGMKAFEKDLRAGLPPPTLLARHLDSIYPSGDPDRVASLLEMMGRGGIIPMPASQEDTTFTEVPLPEDPAAWKKVTWSEGWGQSDGGDAQVVVALQQPQFVSAIRVTLRYAQTSHQEGNLAECKIWWTKSSGNNFPQEGHSARLLHGRPGQRTLTIWVGATIDRICIQPDSGPCVFQIVRVVLLAPENARGHPQPMSCAR